MQAMHKCDFCDAEAIYDGKTTMGPWGFMCEDHFHKYGIKVEGLYSRLKPAETKVCKVCERELPLTEFYLVSHTEKIYYRPECKQCNRSIRKQARMYKSRHKQENV